MARQYSRLYTIAFTVLAISLCLSSQRTFAAQQQPGEDRFVYLPVLFKPINPAFTPLTFLSSLGCASDLTDPKSSPAEYAYGIRQLAVSTYITGATGATFTFTWTLNGAPLPTLTDAGIIPLNNYTHTAIITYNANAPNCDPLPRGTYQTQFYIANILKESATAAVR
jgi:hypothetical protein